MKDLELILNPTLEDFAKFSAFTGGPMLRDGYYGFISDDIFLARCEGYIVGYLTYRRSEVYVELQSIFVAPEFRRRGIAPLSVGSVARCKLQELTISKPEKIKGFLDFIKVFFYFIIF